MIQYPELERKAVREGEAIAHRVIFTYCDLRKRMHAWIHEIMHT